MKNKGVIFSIIFILCAGVFVTNYTKRLVSSGMALEITKEAQRSASSIAGLPEAAAIQTEPETDFSEAEEQPAEEAHFSAADVAAQGADGPALISPLTGSAGTAKSKVPVNAFTSGDYKKKLQDIDAQIKKMKDCGVEPNTDSYKNMAEYEYRLWDNELNAVYQDIIGRMTPEDAEALRTEERQWMKSRDQTAHEAISKYSGGTLESLEYTASMADTTRTRVYGLLEKYGKYLDYFLIEEAD